MKRKFDDTSNTKRIKLENNILQGEELALRIIQNYDFSQRQIISENILNLPSNNRIDWPEIAWEANCLLTQYYNQPVSLTLCLTSEFSVIGILLFS